MAAPKVPVVSTPACGVSRVSTAVTVSPARESDTTMSARATLASPSVKPTVPVRLVASTTVTSTAALPPPEVRVMLPAAGPVPDASRIRVLIPTSALQLATGWKRTSARAAFTSATLPFTLHWPVLAL